ncbi:hypothetical protein [Burkholderia ubonensis]|uniref:hypothetical protein n=1 Tax=Burkholderia ubonensis TaxID=101571 RepID=UPI000A5E1937|nr:hypothetical protein [Burkholderia ubonensis]
MARSFDSGKLFYGMNIHPQYSGAPWHKTPAEVIAEVHELGCTVVRIDCYNPEVDADIVLEHIYEAERKDILVVPCLGYDEPILENDPDINYDAGKYCGEGFAKVLMDHCPIYEVSNEMSVYCNCAGVPGTEPFHYDQEKYINCRELIRGVIDGIKSVQPDAKIIIGGGVTILTGFNKLLWSGTAPDGSSGHPVVRWDFTGWHWYESSGAIDQAGDGTDRPYNVIEDLARFGVPIWITELGFDAFNSDFPQQSVYVNTALAEYRGYRDRYDVINTCWYALYDDGSGDFGLIQVQADASATAEANRDTKAYAKRKSRETALAFKRSKSRQASTITAASGGKSRAATGVQPDSLTRKPAHETFMTFVAANPDHDQPGEEFHTAEYTLPIALYQRLRDAAAEHHVSENDELVQRLATSFAPRWTLYENLKHAAEHNGVSLFDEVVTRLESTFSA